VLYKWKIQAAVTFIVRPGGTQVYLLAGRKDDKNEYESPGVTIKEKLGYAALQRAKERLKLVDQDIIRVGQTAIMMQQILDFNTLLLPRMYIQ